MCRCAQLATLILIPREGNVQSQAGGAWSTLVQWKVSLSMAGCWSEMILKVPSTPNLFVILMYILIYLVE